MWNRVRVVSQGRLAAPSCLGDSSGMNTGPRVGAFLHDRLIRDPFDFEMRGGLIEKERCHWRTMGMEMYEGWKCLVSQA